MKKIWAICCTLFLVLSLSACAKTAQVDSSAAESMSGASSTSNASATDAEEKNVVLRLSTFASDTDLAWWQKGVDAFVESNDVGVTAVEVEVSPWTEYWDKLSTQIVAQTQPDVIMMVSMESEFLIESGALLNLTPYIERDNFDVSDFWDAVTPAYTDADGNRYCLPYDMSTILMCANMDLLEAEGIEHPGDKPWTMDEFIEICQRLTKKDDAGNVTQYGVIDNNFLDWVYYDAILSTGGTLLGDNGLPNFVSDRSVDLLQFLTDLTWKYEVAPIPASGDSTSGSTIFQAGQAAFDLNCNPQWVAIYKESMPDANLDVIPQPWGETAFNGGYTEGGSWACGSNTKYPDQAWALMSSIVSKDTIGNVVADGHLGIPGRQSLSERMLASANAVEHSNLYFTEIEGCEWQTWANKTQVMDTFVQYAERCYLNGEDAEKVMGELQEAIAPLAE